MNLTCQYIVSPKSREAYINSEASYKSIRTTSTRLRVSDDRYVLNSRKRVSFQVDGIGFNMLYCPRGKFMMGSDDDAFNYNPKRPMVIERPFLLGETEVTQELFKTIMGYNPSNFQGQGYPNSNQRPVEQVTWYDAVMFCNKLSEKLNKRPYYNISNEQYIQEKVGRKKVNLPNIESADVTINPQANGFRLPYEKEWEYVANAGTNNKYAGANDDEQLDQVAWYSSKQTRPVKGKRPNEWGFYDMSGNVREWCYDLYHATSADRVVRGGSWGDYASPLRSANRNYNSPGSRSYTLGFRVSASLVN